MKAISIVALLSCVVLLSSYSSVPAQEKRITKPAAVSGETTDRDLDGLNGPVRRVRVEIAKISVKDGNFIEGPRVLRETSTYDPKGKKIDTVAHPVEGTSLPGKEEYRYDDNGNIVEMILRGEDGSILSKESYTYELDEIGNWKKMTSSVAIYENGKLVYEPVEVTYRTISYYFGQAVDKLVAAGKKPDAASVKVSDTKAEAASLKVKETKPQVSETRPPVSETKLPVAETKPPIADTRRQDVETSPAKISQAANTSNEQVNVPTGSVVSGPTNSTTQPSLKPIESNTDKVARTSETALRPVESTTDKIARTTETAAALDSRQPTKAAHAEKPVTNTEATTANSTSQPVEPPSGQPTAEKAEDKKTEGPTNTASTNREVKEPGSTVVKETISNATPANSEKAAEAPSTPANTAAAAYEQGMTHLAANRFPEAVKSLTESVRLNPNDAQTYLKLGVAYSSQAQYKEAVAVLKMALQIKREVVDAQGFYHLGTAYSNLGKHSDALNAFKQALYIMRADAVDTQSTAKNAPPLAHVYHGIGAMYYNLQRPNDAVKELKRALELNPKLADAYYVLALSYIAVGNRKSAEAQRNTLRNLNATLAGKLDKALSSHDSGVHCRSVFGPCQ